jgi:DNA polymerase
MMIGEGPGFHEDRQGLPFVGPAGRFLDQLITSSGLKRKDVFITNVVKCRPPNNRDPMPGEIQACRKHLDEQIEIINPKVIVTLGRFSMARFIPNQTIGRVRAKARQVEGRTIYPMYHPAAALHNGSLRSVIEDDFKAIPSLVDQAAPPAEEPKPAPAQQLDMFSQGR